MTDVLFVLLTIGFFALAAGLVKVCDGFIDDDIVEGDDVVIAPGTETAVGTGAVGA